MLEPAGIAAGASSSAEVVAHALAALWQDGGQSVVGLEQIAEPVVALVAVLALRSAPAGLDTVCVGVVRLLTLLASVASALVRFPAFGARSPCSRRPSFCFGGTFQSTRAVRVAPLLAGHLSGFLAVDRMQGNADAQHHFHVHRVVPTL